MPYQHIDDDLARKIIIRVALHDYSSREVAHIFKTSHRTALNILHKCDVYLPAYTAIIECIIARHKERVYQNFRRGKGGDAQKLSHMRGEIL